MAKMTLFAVSATLRSRTNSAPVLGGPTIDKRRLDPKIVRVNGYVGLFCSLICIGDCRAHALFNTCGSTLARVAQYRQSPVDILPSNHIDDQPGFLCGASQILGACCRFHS